MSSEALSNDRAGLPPLAVYGLLVLVLAVLKFLVGVALVPEGAAYALTVASAFVFLALPISALIVGSKHPWTLKAGGALLLLGAALHVGMFFLVRGSEGVAAVFFAAVRDVGMMGWTLGLGALVSILIKDKNLLLPVVLFLAGFDVLIILTPFTPQAQIVQNNPEIVQNIGMTIPQVRPDTELSRAAGAQIADLAIVGAADLFVTAALFAVLARYRMRFRESAIWIVPVLFVYLGLAIFSPLPGLPALVPIGATVLLVNRKEFQMTKDEKAATWVVALIALGMAGYGVYANLTYIPPAEPTGTLPPEVLQGLPAPEGTP